MYIAKQLALKLGAAFFQEFDSIIPIPLHRKKLKIRGFIKVILLQKVFKTFITFLLNTIVSNGLKTHLVKQIKIE